MYIAALIIPVSPDNRDAYVRWAERSAAIFRKYGCIQVIDGWGDNLPHGRRTDFYRAVEAAPGEEVVINWQVWPDKATLDAAEERMHVDGVLDTADSPPFDARRLIIGCFTPLADKVAP